MHGSTRKPSSLGSITVADPNDLEFRIDDNDRVRLGDTHFTSYQYYERGYAFRTHNRPFQKRFFTRKEVRRLILLGEGEIERRYYLRHRE